jgi:hypothetical protein
MFVALTHPVSEIRLKLLPDISPNLLALNSKVF